MLFSLLKHYLELFITDTALKVSRSFTVSPLLYLLVLKTYSPVCGIRASLMLFFHNLAALFKQRVPNDNTTAILEVMKNNLLR